MITSRCATDRKIEVMDTVKMRNRVLTRCFGNKVPEEVLTKVFTTSLFKEMLRHHRLQLNGMFTVRLMFDFEYDYVDHRVEKVIAGVIATQCKKSPKEPIYLCTDPDKREKLLNG